MKGRERARGYLTLQSLIELAGYATRSYEGRGMYGKSCLAVYISRDGSVGGLVATVMTAAADEGVDSSLIAEAFRTMKEDSMGKGSVVYFRGHTWRNWESTAHSEVVICEAQALEDARARKGGRKARLIKTMADVVETVATTDEEVGSCRN